MSMSCVARGSPCAALAKDPAIMNGTLDRSRAATSLWSRSRSSFIVQCRPYAAGKRITPYTPENLLAGSLVRQFRPATPESVDGDAANILTQLSGKSQTPSGTEPTRSGNLRILR